MFSLEKRNVNMSLQRLITSGVLLVLVAGTAAGEQAATVSSKQATAFIGNWVIDMTSPPELIGTQETVRIWEKDGFVVASVQVAKFPPNDVTGVLRDRDLLVLSTTLRENGQPIWVVISLKVQGETMMLAQMMEQSSTIKRGIGKKQAN
jgi:phosphatidate phosphatase APP1